jgi:hypothetical protein
MKQPEVKISWDFRPMQVYINAIKNNNFFISNNFSAKISIKIINFAEKI